MVTELEPISVFGMPCVTRNDVKLTPRRGGAYMQKKRAERPSVTM